MRIVFAGTPEFAVPSLRFLVEAGHDVLGVITREDAPIGRKRVLTPSPVAAAAGELGLRVLKANRLGDEATEWVAALGGHSGSERPELGVIVAYGGLVREPLLSLPESGWINLHFSELPRWRGAAPVQRALMAGERRLGVTVFRLVPELDAGDILSEDARDFAPGTSAGEALAELADFGTSALDRAVRALEADPAAGTAQEGEPSYAHKLGREDGRLDLTLPAEVVLARWAGVTPEPGAFVLHDAQPLKLQRLGVVEAPGDAASGAATPSGTARLVGGRAILHPGSGALEMIRVQPAGKPEMDGAAWLRGRGGEAVLS